MYCPLGKTHKLSAEELLQDKYGAAGMSDDQKIITIEMGWGFERYGSYESWDSGYDVDLYALRTDYKHWSLGQHMFLDKPLQARSLCLTCAVEKVLKKAEELECREP